jgi:hypothetical protein
MNFSAMNFSAMNFGHFPLLSTIVDRGRRVLMTKPLIVTLLSFICSHRFLTLLLIRVTSKSRVGTDVGFRLSRKPLAGNPLATLS